MITSKQLHDWDVTYILPRGKKAIYRQVPLANVADLVALTREVAITFMNAHFTKAKSSRKSTKGCFLPGFIVYHVLPNSLKNSDIVALSSNEASWHLLLQRQDREKLITLQIALDESGVGGGGGAIIYDPLSPSPQKDERKQSNLILASTNEDVNTQGENGHVSANVSKGAGKQSCKNEEPTLHEPKHLMAFSSSRETLDVGKNIKETHMIHFSDSRKVMSTAALTVRQFVLLYVVNMILSLSQCPDSSKKGAELVLPPLTRADFAYFAAAVVKVWQSRLMLSSAAMQETWDTLPSLLQDAQRDFLDSVTKEFWTRLCGTVKLGRRRFSGKMQSPQNNLQKMVLGHERNRNTKEADEESFSVIEEATYCSSAGPLPLPIGKVSVGRLLLSLNAPSQVSILEELVIVGHIHSKNNSIGLLWWLVEHGPHSQPYDSKSEGGNCLPLVPLDALYRQQRIKTLQVTPNTFLLIIKPRSLLSSMRYCFFLEAYDLRAGDTVVSQIEVCTLAESQEKKL